MKRDWTEGVCFQDQDFVFRILQEWRTGDFQVGGQFRIYEEDGQKWVNGTLTQDSIDHLRWEREYALKGGEEHETQTLQRTDGR